MGELLGHGENHRWQAVVGADVYVYEQGVAICCGGALNQGADIQKVVVGAVGRLAVGDVNHYGRETILVLRLLAPLLNQVACLVHERKTAAEAIADLMAQAELRAGMNLQALADANARCAGTKEA